jgi:hypothetical protein
VQPELQQRELIEALKMRGVAGRTAQELVAAHPAGRIRAKLDVFDWLLRNEDRRVGKNPAGYLVASIRADYRTPSDYETQRAAVRSSGNTRASKAELQRPPEGKQEGCVAAQAEHDKAREARLREAWEKLAEAEREAIWAVVKAENPGLGRWKSVLEPLCLAVLEARMNESGEGFGQRMLFPDGEPPQ